MLQQQTTAPLCLLGTGTCAQGQKHAVPHDHDFAWNCSRGAFCVFNNLWVFILIAHQSVTYCVAHIAPGNIYIKPDYAEPEILTCAAHLDDPPTFAPWTTRVMLDDTEFTALLDTNASARFDATCWY
jgi:hypothetical protein